MVICLERGADLHMAQLMPLPLTVSSFSIIQIGFTFLVLADPGKPGKGPLNVCMYYVVNMFVYGFQEFKVPSGFCLTTHAFDCQVKVNIMLHQCCLLFLSYIL